LAQARTIVLARHVCAGGRFERMLIDRKWVDAASGKRFESRNPATESCILLLLYEATR
jgi:aldehyde dehydrogenase (NAD+)